MVHMLKIKFCFSQKLVFDSGDRPMYGYFTVILYRILNNKWFLKIVDLAKFRILIDN